MGLTDLIFHEMELKRSTLALYGITAFVYFSQQPINPTRTRVEGQDAQPERKIGA
jgi:hypothetical protein